MSSGGAEDVHGIDNGFVSFPLEETIPFCSLDVARPTRDTKGSNEKNKLLGYPKPALS